MYIQGARVSVAPSSFSPKNFIPLLIIFALVGSATLVQLRSSESKPRTNPFMESMRKPRTVHGSDSVVSVVLYLRSQRIRFISPSTQVRSVVDM